MSVTYTEDRIEPVAEETFVPVYARSRTASKRKGGVKTWMILAPIGAVVVLGGAAAMLMGGGEETVEPALVEPAATAPVFPATPVPTDVAAAPLTSAATPTPVEMAQQPTPAPVARTSEPARRAAPAPARRAAPAPAPAARVETPAAPTNPQPYSAPATSTLNTTPATPVPAPAAPRAPTIQVQPLN